MLYSGPPDPEDQQAHYDTAKDAENDREEKELQLPIAHQLRILGKKKFPQSFHSSPAEFSGSIGCEVLQAE